MTEHLLDGVLVRAATYLALALCIGPVLWSSWCEPGTQLRLSRRRAIAIGGLLGVAATLAVIHTMLTFADRWSWSAAVEVLRTTDYGHRILWYVGGCAALALATIRARSITVLLAATATSLALARIGHAATGTLLGLAVHLVHVLAASAWVGGLLVLVQRASARTLTLDPLLRFSRLAGGLVAILVVTGVLRTLGVATSLDVLAAWSLALALKLALLAVALLIALGHRRKRLPQLRVSAAGWPRMEVMLTLELWLVLCALLLAGLLSQLEPP